MPATFDWDNTEDIAIALTDKYPETDPLSVRFTDIQRRQARSHPDGLARRISRSSELKRASEISAEN